MQNIHPLFVHFPIALVLGSLFLEVVGLLTKREALRTMATGALVLGTFGALAAMTTGLMAGDSVPHLEAAHEILETHEELGIAVAILASILTVARLVKLDNIKFLRVIFVALFIITAGIMSYGAYLGGELVYEHGVGTALVKTGMVMPPENEAAQPGEMEEHEH